MEIINKLRCSIGSGIAAIGIFLSMGTWVFGVMLHLYTILIAFKMSGFMAAFIALSLPVLAQIYWFFVAWNKTGEFINGFSFYIILYVGYLVISFSLMAIGSWLYKERT